MSCTALNRTVEYKQKMSIKQTGRIVDWWKGKHHTEETKLIISHSKIGKPRSEETKRKLSISNTGKKHSLETRQKMSESKKGKNNPNYQGKS